jgi:hypothetical protein
MVPTNETFGKAVARSTIGRPTYKAGVAYPFGKAVARSTDGRPTYKAG